MKLILLLQANPSHFYASPLFSSFTTLLFPSSPQSCIRWNHKPSVVPAPPPPVREKVPYALSSPAGRYSTPRHSDRWLPLEANFPNFGFLKINWLQDFPCPQPKPICLSYGSTQANFSVWQNWFNSQQTQLYFNTCVHRWMVVVYHRRSRRRKREV